MYIVVHSFIVFSISVRVTGGITPNYGRVEMLTGNNWLPFCDTNFDDSDAKVVCKEIGYLYGKAQCCSAIGAIAADSTMVTDLQCTGSESNIDACPSKTGSCSSGKTASVYCSNKAITENSKFIAWFGSFWKGVPR